MRILVVEDERNLQNVIRKRLEKEHYSTDGVGDGAEALEYIRQTDYDAVILDIMLPGMPGTEVLKTMRREGKRTPVLFLTARDAIEDRVRGKPYDEYKDTPGAQRGCRDRPVRKRIPDSGVSSAQQGMRPNKRSHRGTCMEL